ncbi:MAG: rhodanese-like domain-containing protein [Kiritimatiellae bacterium]|nr:rhodanese-like domain-containing protein [Kiritimatiellia bacterium]
MNAVHAVGGIAAHPARQAAALCLAGALLAMTVNALNPRGLALTRAWTPPDARAARAAGVPLADAFREAARPMRGGLLVLDARAEREYRRGHLPGAISLPWERFARVYPRVEPLLADPAQAVLVYCEHSQCDDGLSLALELRRRGATEVTLLQGGYETWRLAGGAIERESPP